MAHTPKDPLTAHRPNSGNAKIAHQYARNLREVYVASRLRRWIREEGKLMVAFDAAPDLTARLAALGGLIKVRLLILRGIGWPKEPTFKGKMPTALSGNHNPMEDIDVMAMTVPLPPEPEPENTASAA